MPATSFSNLITFSRGTNATVTDSTGRLTYAPNNLFTFSEQFDNAAWSKFATTVTANATTAPDGTLTADRILETTATSTHLVAANAMVSVVTGQSYTISVYVKQSGRNWFRITSNFSGGSYASFDIANGVLGTVSGGTATITDAGNGWWRCSLTVVATSTGTASPDFRLATSNTAISYAGNASLGVFFWGAQMEQVTYQTTPSTYYPTTVKNLLGFSQDFSNAGWSKTRTVIAGCPFANPVDGLFTANKFMEDANSSNHYLSQNVAVLSGTPYTFSVYAKSDGRNLVLEFASSGFGANKQASFDLSNGTTTALSGVTSSITPVGNDWYRCSAICTATASVTTALYAILANGATLSYTGDGNSGIYIFGAQLSDSASLDPYVPTPAAAPSSTAYYGPRLDYDPVTLAPKGLLVEEARTNIILTSTFSTLAGSAGSQYPSGTGWSNFFNTGGARTFVASSVFSGAQAMDIAGVSAARNLIGFSFAAASSTTYTVSFYVEAVSGITGIVAYATGTLGTGGTSNNVTAPTATGRYFYTFTTGTSAGTVDLRFGIGAASNESGSIRISNVQLEAGAFATSYIPTVASTVTRSADVATITGSLFSGWYRQDQGTMLVATSRLSTAAIDGVSAAAYTTGSDTIEMFARNDNNRLFVAVGGVTQVNLIDTGKIAAGVTYKSGAAYNLNDYALVTNGGTVLTDASATVPAAVLFGIGSRGGSLPFNGHIRSVQYIPNRNSDAQLQSLTAG